MARRLDVANQPQRFYSEYYTPLHLFSHVLALPRCRLDFHFLICLPHGGDMSIQEIQGSVKTYVIGLSICVLLTIIPYYIVVHHLLSGWHLVAAIMGTAVVQGLLQMILFLHLGDEDRPRWNVMAFL